MYTNIKGPVFRGAEPGPGRYPEGFWVLMKVRYICSDNICHRVQLFEVVLRGAAEPGSTSGCPSVGLQHMMVSVVNLYFLHMVRL